MSLAALSLSSSHSLSEGDGTHRLSLCTEERVHLSLPALIHMLDFVSTWHIAEACVGRVALGCGCVSLASIPALLLLLLRCSR